MTEKILKDLMIHNEALYKETTRLREIIAIYKQALTDLQAHPTAKNVLEKVRKMDVKGR